MRRVDLSDLRPGMILGRTVYNDRGGILLRGGVELNDRYIEALRSRGFLSTYIRSGVGDDVEPVEVVSETVRTATRKHINDLFSLVRRAGEAPRGARPMAASPGSAEPYLVKICEDINKIVDEALGASVLTGVTSLKSHDNYSFEHSIEVTVVGVMLGKRLRMDLEDLRELALGCLIHDIGKLTVPSEILTKPGRLTPEEMAIVQEHPGKGYDLARELLPAHTVIARNVVWQHHERQDGSGYPRGLTGNNRLGYNRIARLGQRRIIFAAEVAAVADVYSAIASDRPYRAAMDAANVVSCMRGMAGGHLNREIVERFLSILPLYPVGTEVIALSGEPRGCRGVVVSVDAAALDRPIVRFIQKASGENIEPFEVELTHQPDIEIASGDRALLPA